MQDKNKRDIFEFDDGDMPSKKRPNKKDIPMHAATDDIFDDIMSDTKLVKKSGKHSYAKKRRGFAKWWFNRKKWQRATMITVASILVVVGIIAGVFFTMFDYNFNDISNNPEDLGFESVIDNKVINVALFGIDTRDKTSFKGLSDSIMILSINTETKKIKIVSVMRDSLVPITYDGKTTYNKINSAYAKGGPELAIKTLNTIFDLDISEYATVNFYGMSDIIDACGGIDATLTEDEVESAGYKNGKHGINDMIDEICGYLEIDASDYHVSKAGDAHLNGIQAVAYSRIRYCVNVWGTNNDYGRTDRQRYVMEQLFNKAVTLGKTEYIKLAKALIPCSETSLTYSQIMNLAVNVLLHNPSFEQSRVPLTEYTMPAPSNSGVGSCVYYDLDFATKLIHSFIYDNIKPEDYIEQNGVEKNDWFNGSKNSGKNNNTTSGSTGGSSSKTHTTSEDTTTNHSSSSTSSHSYTSSETSSTYSSNTHSSGSTSTPSSSTSSNNSTPNTSSEKPVTSTPSESTTSSEKPPVDTPQVEDAN